MIQHGLKKRFARLPLDLLLDKTVSRSSVILMTVLADIADYEGCVDFTIDQLCRYTKLSEKTIRRSLRELYERGAIRQIDRTGRASYIWLAEEYRTGSAYSAIIAELKTRKERIG